MAFCNLIVLLEKYLVPCWYCRENEIYGLGYMAPLFWMSWFLNLTLGNALLLGVWHYERFGGDPQKRSLQNRLVSEIAISGLLGTFHRYISFVKE